MTDNQLQPNNSQFSLYQDDNGITNVNVRFDGKDVWLTQQQIAMLFDTTQQNISLHINGILEEGELLKEATHKYFLLVRQEGNRSVKRQIEHYNLDMIIAVAHIYQEGELAENLTCRNFRQVRLEGKKQVARKCCNTKAISTELLKN